MKDYSKKAKDDYLKECNQIIKEDAVLEFCLENDIELWKQIPGYPNYSASTKGNIRNNTTGKILKPRLNGRKNTKQRLSVMLCKKGKHKDLKVHRLILTTFRGKCPEGMECDHINRNCKDNSLINLRWVTRKENNRNRSTNRKVNQFDLEDNFIRTYDTIIEAVETLNLPKRAESNIYHCCKGDIKTAYGYKWQYADTDITANEIMEAVKDGYKRSY